MAKKRNRNTKYYKEQRKLETQYKTLVKDINAMFKAFKKAGFTSYSPAQQKLLSMLPSGVEGKRTAFLTRPKTRKKETYKKAIQEFKKFKEYKTATPAGWKKVLDSRRKTLIDKYGESVARLPDSQLNELLEFLGSENGGRSKVQYDSDQVIEVLAVLKSKDSAKSFDDLWDEVQESKKGLFEYLWEFEDEVPGDDEWLEL